MSVTCLPESLIRAYRATRYRVFASPDFELAVGQRSSALADLYRAHAANSAAFLTAWNPEGNLQNETANREAFARLQERVAPCKRQHRATDTSALKPDLHRLL